METLKVGSLLKGGEYKIVGILGQGGFGITYEAEQIGLKRRVAVKEFFFKGSCERVSDSSKVSVPTASNRELVEKFRQKFIREAQMIAAMDHDHIVRIYDVFEENGTAYYVMEYLPGGSLSDVIKAKGALSESTAVNYIRQIADALNYLHEQNTLHLDVKPSNVLLNQKGQLKLIDFGISKHYDEAGSQTSSTPVGISKGYAPLEQYQQGGDVSKFTPATDIYALGATLYYLVTGTVPPDASEVNEEGLPAIPGVSTPLAVTIEKSMSPRKKDRPQSVEAFLSLLDAKNTYIDSEETTIINKPKPSSTPSIAPALSRYVPKWIWGLLFAVVVLVLCIALWPRTKTNYLEQDQGLNQVDTAKIITEPTKPVVVAIKKIELNKTSLTLEEGKTSSLTVNYIPSNATDKTTVWESSNTGIAKVDKSGKVTAIKSGVVTIVAKCGSLSASCKVTVTVKPSLDDSVKPVPVVIDLQKIEISKTSLALREGETAILTVLYTPSNATDKSTIWESSNTSVVRIDESGRVSAIKAGKAIISAKCGTLSASCNILVSAKEEPSKVEAPYNEYDEEDKEEPIPFQLVDQRPSFQGGGPNNFTLWVNEHLEYPESAKKNGVQGRVTLQFTVEKDGRVTNVKVLRGVDSALDKEAMRVVSMSPRWKPGKQRNKTVRVTYTFPVIFKLE